MVAARGQLLTITATDAKSKDQALIATGNTAGQVFIFDVKNDWKQSKQEPHQKMVRSLCFTQDCHKLVTASDDKQTKVIDLVKLEPIMTFTGHKGNINCVDCSPVDNKIVMTWYAHISLIHGLLPLLVWWARCEAMLYTHICI